MQSLQFLILLFSWLTPKTFFYLLNHDNEWRCDWLLLPLTCLLTFLQTSPTYIVSHLTECIKQTLDFSAPFLINFDHDDHLEDDEDLPLMNFLTSHSLIPTQSSSIPIILIKYDDLSLSICLSLLISSGILLHAFNPYTPSIITNEWMASYFSFASWHEWSHQALSWWPAAVRITLTHGNQPRHQEHPVIRMPRILYHWIMCHQENTDWYFMLIMVLDGLKPWGTPPWLFMSWIMVSWRVPHLSHRQ